ncbi:M14 family zinc carboxypeptidase [Streptosporangium amethystogenes]|uniref:M14 family zinc carboxypeptidase n=1 Tax=Streptosporangium amethystogenes TaxID=2002 RepID=UPI00068C911D|nr:M14 family zinc carboxypeptidase [Streptosporangium amethystogenes]
MLKRFKVVAPAVLAVAIALPAGAAQADPTPAAPPVTTCDATQTPAVYHGKVPTPKSVLGFDLGEREVTSAESDTLLTAIDAASDRVVSGTLATTAQGRPLKYAIVGTSQNIRNLRAIENSIKLLRNPLTPAPAAKLLARNTPAILWIAGNVHGGEESGTDAALKTLYDLAGRDDCAARRILDNAVTVILPTQNPDGREADTRRNAYAFDMNRDWFARTQPETDGKIELMRKYPPQLFIDAHEMGGTEYFFPPNADPIYHDIAEPTVDWINNTYGAAMIGEFTRRGIPFFNRSVYDLFYMGYGDTVPAGGFNAAGMTFEKGNASPIATRTFEQWLTQWVSLSAAAAKKTEILTTWHGMYADALKQGLNGHLEPNQVYNPGHEVITQVPDRKVRHYFLRADDPAKKAETDLVVRRLQRMDVQVYKLATPLTVKDFKAYGRPEAKTTLPKGTYWIPLAQAQKHWVQAMLNEDTYTPFPYFYDVTAWSLPLLGNVSGGSSGQVLLPIATPVRAVDAPSVKVTTSRKIGVLQLSGGTAQNAAESSGWLRHRLDRDWKLSYQVLTPADVAAGRLGGLDVLLVPDGSSNSANNALGEAGRAALRDWVGGGGRYVGWAGGARLAALAGVSSVTLTEPTSDIPGSLLRTNVAQGPLSRDVGSSVMQFYAYDLVMRASNPSHVVTSYPAADSPDWFLSGFALGAEELAGTAAAVDEPVGRGHAVLFAAEPNFRAFSDGTAKIVANAITADLPSASARARTLAPAPDASKTAAAIPEHESPIRVTVPASDRDKAAAALNGFGATWTEQAAPGGAVRFVVANPEGLDTHEHPWARKVPDALRAAGVSPLAVVLPQ